MKYTFGFIGAGNMGSALIKATATNFKKEEIAFYDKHEDKRNKLLEYATPLLSAKEVAKNCEIIFIGVKPQSYQNTFDEIKEELIENKNAVIVSMAAGVSIDGVKKISGLDLPVIRIMPNTPCKIGSGVILYSFGAGVPDTVKANFLSAINGAGFADEIEEEKIDIASVISGCGPAFFYSFINAVAKAGERYGLPYEKALQYACKTAEGSAKNVMASGEEVQALIDAVCSKGGTTIEGVKSFISSDLDGVVDKAILASFTRTLELKK